jgi:DNA-binding SARP family transcriptional activator
LIHRRRLHDVLDASGGVVWVTGPALAGHRAVPVSTVIDQLWPDADGDLAKGSLEATLHRARKALDEPAAITSRQGTLGLEVTTVGVDAARLHAWLARVEGELQSAAHDPSSLRPWCEDLCRQYPGPIAVPYELTNAAEPARRQLTAQVAKLASKLVAHARRAADTAYADEFLRLLVARDPALARLIRD